MTLKHLSTKSSLLITFGTLTVVVLVVSGVSLKALGDSNDRFYSYVNGINARADKAREVRAAVDDRAMAVRNLVLVSAPADIQIEKAAVTDAEQRVETALAEFNTMVANASDMSELSRGNAAEISRVEAQYRPVALDIDRLARGGQQSRLVER
ncbi:MAG: MCP four helix bundle domain-containing protein, partial [Burkholderia gladioli]